MVGSKQYSFRLGEGMASAALDRQANQSDFIRRALEHEIARQQGPVADSSGNEAVLARLAALERGNEVLAAAMKQLLLELRALAELARRPGETPGNGADAAAYPSREELRTAFRVILWSVQTRLPWSGSEQHSDEPEPV